MPMVLEETSVLCLLIFQDIETPVEDSVQEPSAYTQVKKRISGLWLNGTSDHGTSWRAMCTPSPPCLFTFVDVLSAACGKRSASIHASSSHAC